MAIVDANVETYMASLLDRYTDPVLEEMEAEAARRDFPIVGRQVGVTLEVLARSIVARRVFELGSGYGYSAYWFARAAVDVHCTDTSPENAARAAGYLGRAGIAAAITWHTGEAIGELAATPGDFDIVFCDIDKTGYPQAWTAAKDRIRVGGLYLCDNVLWHGRVAESGPRDEPTEAILRHNRMIAADERFASTIIPTRDGLMVALRLR